LTTSGITEEKQKELEERTADAKISQMGAVEAGAQAQQQHFMTQIGRSKEEQARTMTQFQALQNPLDKQQAYVKSQIQALDAERERVKNLQVDDRDYFKNNMGSVVLGSIAAGMVEAGHIMAGSNAPNTAAMMIQRSIDNNINKQIENIQKAKGDYQDKAAFFEKFGTLDLDELKLKQQILGRDHAAALVRQYAAEEGLASIAPQSLQAAAQIEESANKQYIELAKMKQVQAVDKYHMATPATETARINPAWESTQKARKLMGEAGTAVREGTYDPATDEHSIKLGGQNIVRVPTKDQKDIQDKEVASYEMYRALVKLSDIAAKGSNFTKEDHDNWNATAAYAKPRLSQASGSGVINKSDEAFIDDMLGSGLDAVTSSSSRKSRITAENIKMGAKQRLVDTYGADPKDFETAYAGEHLESEKAKKAKGE
jgi:hypothetical protein